MSNNESSKFKVFVDPQKSNKQKIAKFENFSAPVIKEFEFGSIATPHSGSYEDTKTKFGPISVTDPDRPVRAQKDSRFSMNSLLREPLSVDKEERRVIEERVKNIVTEIAEREKNAASLVGYEEGYKKGFDEAYKKLRGEGANKIEQFEKLLLSFNESRSEIFKINERIIIEMVFKIAKMLLLKELSTDKEYILRLAKELVERVGVKDNLIIRINPSDAEVIGLLKGGLEKAFAGLTNLSIDVNSRISQGGCEIETEWNAINASIEIQLEEVYRSLLAGREKTEDIKADGEA